MGIDVDQLPKAENGMIVSLGDNSKSSVSRKYEDSEFVIGIGCGTVSLSQWSHFSLARAGSALHTCVFVTRHVQSDSACLLARLWNLFHSFVLHTRVGRRKGPFSGPPIRQGASDDRHRYCDAATMTLACLVFCMGSLFARQISLAPCRTCLLLDRS
jgi:hypothetical protein